MEKCFLFLLLLFEIKSSMVLAQLQKKAEYPPVVLATTQQLEFTSAINHQHYTVAINTPGSYKDSATKKYPVLYELDGQWSFAPALGLLGGLNYDGLVPEVITVAIGWKDSYDSNRTRDFTPTVTQNQYPTGGAPQFIEVIQKEIKTFIDENYHTDPSNNIISGGSYGGLLLLYLLFTHPTLFNSYIIGSPSVDYDASMLFKMQEKFSQTHKELNARIFFHWGRYESNFDPENKFGKMYLALQKSHYKGLLMDSVSVEKMAHASNGPYGEGLGLQFVLQRADIALDTKLLDEYAGHYEENIELVREGNALFFKLPFLKIKLNAENENRFYVTGVGGTASFSRDAKGKITAYCINVNGQPQCVKRL